MHFVDDIHLGDDDYQVLEHARMERLRKERGEHDERSYQEFLRNMHRYKREGDD